MSPQKKIIKESLLFEFHNDIVINGLDQFRKKMEKEFFCDCNIKKFAVQGKGMRLVIEVNANFNLLEAVFHKKNRQLHHMRITGDKHQLEALTINEAFFELQEKNPFPIDIEELVVNLMDVSFIISKIYDNSISEEIGNLFDEICNHYVYFSKELEDIPYEVFIPILSEEQLGHHLLPTAPTNDYFKYWGVYFNGNSNADIYNLQSRSIMDGDVFVLNQ